MIQQDLHDVFIDELCKRVPRRVELVSFISDTLRLEREPVYRRMSGKVHFSVREMGIIARVLDISLDSLLYKKDVFQWLPVVLESPLKLDSMDSLYCNIERNMDFIREITCKETAEMGSIHNTLPMEFFITSPLLCKFMFFRWGHYFVRSEEFNDFSSWEIPPRLSDIIKSYEGIYDFNKAFYIWDNSLIWTMSQEIGNLFLMNIITENEKEEIKNEINELLTRMEQVLNGTHTSRVPLPDGTAFYVSSINLGFSSSYFVSEEKNLATFQTNFSFSYINNPGEGIERMKEWIKSFRNISTLLSESGRIERRKFFDTQHKIVDHIL